MKDSQKPGKRERSGAELVWGGKTAGRLLIQQVGCRGMLSGIGSNLPSLLEASSGTHRRQNNPQVYRCKRTFVNKDQAQIVTSRIFLVHVAEGGRQIEPAEEQTDRDRFTCELSVHRGRDFTGGVGLHIATGPAAFQTTATANTMQRTS